jgi:hypothetical protein
MPPEDKTWHELPEEKMEQIQEPQKRIYCPILDMEEVFTKK